MASQGERYTKVAIILHWVIALMIIGLIAAGILMTKLEPYSSLQVNMYQIHKSFGITVLLLSLVRLIWRLTHKPPALPDHMPGWEKLAARFTHVAFYLVMIGMPLLGWAMVSVSPLNIPTKLFFTVPWPHLPILPGIENKKEVEEVFKFLHANIGKATIVLILLHVGAALKHHFKEKDIVLTRMLPWIKPRSG